MIQHEEYDQRLSDICDGPWANGARKAQEFLEPKTDLSTLASSDREINLSSLSLSLEETDLKRESELLRIFRPHWEEPIDSREEMDLRNSFDEALVLPQLLELGIETGYLSVEGVRQFARRYLLSMLWSQGARRFVEAYDYITVGYLGKRVGIDLLRIAGLPPEPKASQEVYFASFLSQHATWSDDSSIQHWLQLLDDYCHFDNESSVFFGYLQTERLPEQLPWPAHHIVEHFLDLVIGVQRFVDLLGTLFVGLEDREKLSYGLFYLYWLAKFFGCERVEDGFVEVGRKWGDALFGPIFIPADLSPEQQANCRDRLGKGINAMRAAWEQASSLIANSSGISKSRASDQINDPDSYLRVGLDRAQEERSTEDSSETIRPYEAGEKIRKGSLNSDNQGAIVGSRDFERESEFFEQVVHISRITKRSGKKRSLFSAVVVIGDGNGQVGWGVGKAEEVPSAIRKGIEDAKRNMINVSVLGATISHKVVGVFGNVKVVVRPAQSGAGVTASGPVRAVLEAAGIQDVLSKNVGSSNPLNIIRATFIALSALSELRNSQSKAKAEEYAAEQWPEEAAAGADAEEMQRA